MRAPIRCSDRRYCWAAALLLLAGAILALAARDGEVALASGDRLAQAQALRRISDRNFFLALVWHWGLLILLLSTGISARWQRWVATRIGARGVAEALFFTTLLLIVNLAGWPFEYVAGYLVSRRFGLNVQTPPAWLQDQALSAGIEIALGVPTLLVIYWLIRRWARRWWLAASVLGVGTAIITSMLWPVVIDPLFNEYTPVTDPEILERVERLSEVTGVPIGAVLRVDMGRRTTAANAWVTGLWGTRRIVIGDTLLDRYSPDEVEAVLAHELGHVVHQDVWRGTMALVVAQTVGLFVLARTADRLLARCGRGWGVSRLSNPATVPLVLLLLSVLFTIGMPALNAASRWREAEADRYALRVTSNPAAMADFFKAIAAQNLSDPAPPRWHVWLFMSHPPLAERIEMVREHLASGRHSLSTPPKTHLPDWMVPSLAIAPNTESAPAALSQTPVECSTPRPPTRAGTGSGTHSSIEEVTSIAGESEARTEQYLFRARSAARSSCSAEIPAAVTSKSRWMRW